MHASITEAKLILIASSAIILMLGVVLVGALFIYQKRKYSHKQQLLYMQNQYEKTLLHSELKVQQETSKAISQNLHDNIGSNISTSMLLLYRDDTMTDEETETNRKEALQIMDRIVDDLKHIARSLNPDYLEQIGLGEAVRQRIRQLQKIKRYQVAACIEDAPRTLEPDKQLILFYIFQEAVNNINTHAGAKMIDINLSFTSEQLCMMIQDDGRGIPQTLSGEYRQHRGSGLMNMKQYGQLIGASLEIESLQGMGTRITVSLQKPYLI